MRRVKPVYDAFQTVGSSWDDTCRQHLTVVRSRTNKVWLSLTRFRLVPCPNVGQASTNRYLRLYPGDCFSCIVTNLHPSVI